MFKIRLSELLLLVLLVIVRPVLHAQSPAYHMELRPEGKGVAHVFVNDGPKPVEAFIVFMRVGGGSNTMSGDYLQCGTGDISDVERIPEHRRGQHNLLAQGDGYRTFFYGPAATPGYPEVKAVIFSDGSAEGDPIRLAALQAAHDGYSDEVNFWVDRLNREDPVAPNWDALVADGEAREKAAKKQEQTHHHVIENEHEVIQDQGGAYWFAREVVDMNFHQNLVSYYEKGPGLSGMRSMFVGWKGKIDNDQAKAVLEATYPLPEAIRLEAQKAYTPTPPEQPLQ